MAVVGFGALHAPGALLDVAALVPGIRDVFTTSDPPKIREANGYAKALGTSMVHGTYTGRRRNDIGATVGPK